MIPSRLSALFTVAYRNRRRGSKKCSKIKSLKMRNLLASIVLAVSSRRFDLPFKNRKS